MAGFGMSVRQCIVGISTVAFVFGVMPLVLGIALGQQSQEMTDSIARGKALAVTNCSRCHSVSLEGESPNIKAPTFRNFSSYHRIDSIHRLLLEKTNSEHTEMPQFKITLEQTGDIIAWIEWLQPVPHGKRLVVKNCSRCHAVDLYDESVHPAAPAFRDLSRRYPINSLEATFAERIETGHRDMPIFRASKDQLLDMIAYIETLQSSKDD